MKKPSREDMSWIERFSKRREAIGLPPLSISMKMHLRDHPMRKKSTKVCLENLQQAYRNFYMEMYVYFKQNTPKEKIPRKIGSVWKKISDAEKMNWFDTETNSHPTYYCPRKITTSEQMPPPKPPSKPTQIPKLTQLPKPPSQPIVQISHQPTASYVPILPANLNTAYWKKYYELFTQYSSFLHQQGLLTTKQSTNTK